MFVFVNKVFFFSPFHDLCCHQIFEDIGWSLLLLVDGNFLLINGIYDNYY